VGLKFHEGASVAVSQKATLLQLTKRCYSAIQSHGGIRFYQILVADA